MERLADHRVSQGRPAGDLESVSYSRSSQMRPVTQALGNEFLHYCQERCNLSVFLMYFYLL